VPAELAVIGIVAWYLAQFLMSFLRIDSGGKAVVVSGCDTGFGRVRAVRHHHDLLLIWLLGSPPKMTPVSSSHIPNLFRALLLDWLCRLPHASVLASPAMARFPVRTNVHRVIHVVVAVCSFCFPLRVRHVQQFLSGGRSST
jgi:hypothetical protein